MSASSSGPPGSVTLPVAVRGKQEVLFLPHALHRMRIRSVTQDDVVAALLQPDEEDLPADPPHGRLRRYWSSDRALDVVYDMTDVQVVVVSVFWKNKDISTGVWS